MSCIYQQGKRKDLDYVRKLAKTYSITFQTDVEIFNDTLPVIGKVYSFAPKSVGRSGIVEVIEFRQPESETVLPDIADAELIVAEPVKPKSKKRGDSGTLVSDSGEILS